MPGARTQPETPPGPPVDHDSATPFHPPTDDAARSDPGRPAPRRRWDVRQSTGPAWLITCAGAAARAHAHIRARLLRDTPGHGSAPHGVRGRRVRTLRAWRRVRLIAVTAAVALIAGACVLVLAGWAMVRGSPTWWRQIDPDDPRTIAWAETVHRAVGQHLTERRTGDQAHAASYVPESGGSRWQSEPWRVSLEPQDANAWLNVELPRWLNATGDGTGWPKAFSQLQVEFRDGHLYIGVRVEADGRSQVLSASLRPEVREDGSLWVPADWVHVGRLPVPAAWVLGEAEQRLPDLVPDELRRLPETRAMLRAFAGEHAIVQEPVVRLPDDRYVRLLSIRSRNGRLEVTCRTEAR